MIVQACNSELVIIVLRTHFPMFILHLLQSPQLLSYWLFQYLLTFCVVGVSIVSLHFEQALPGFFTKRHSFQLFALDTKLDDLLSRVLLALLEMQKPAAEKT